jgi:Zn-dependent protease/predicted transcriptional regulator
MKWSWSLGRLAGIDVRIHATFLLLLAYVAYIGYQRGGTASAALFGVLFLLLLFASVVAHEFGHALTARRFGVGTRNITLLPIGGVAQLERMPREPRQELLIALAGPAVTLAIAGLLYLVLRLTGSTLSRAALTDDPSILVSLLVTNVTILIFNMLPAFPMDGGRVLRAALAMRLDYVRATQIAASLGKAFALLFGLFGLWSQEPLMMLIALFVWMGAAGEAVSTQFRSSLSGVTVDRAMVRDVRTLSPEQPLSAAVEMARSGFQQDFPVVLDGRVVGVLTRKALVSTLARRGHAASVSEAMDTAFVTATPGEPLDEAFARLSECRCHTMPVVRDGMLEGVLTTDAVAEFVSVESALDGGRRKRTDAPTV